MSWFTSLWRNRVHRERVERDLDDELRAAFELLVEEKLRAGMRAKDARRAALIELGGIESIKEQVRAVRAGAFIDSLLRDALEIRVEASTARGSAAAISSRATGRRATRRLGRPASHANRRRERHRDRAV